MKMEPFSCSKEPILLQDRYTAVDLPSEMRLDVHTGGRPDPEILIWSDSSDYLEIYLRQFNWPRAVLVPI
jgi:hypothetical protein